MKFLGFLYILLCRFSHKKELWALVMKLDEEVRCLYVDKKVFFLLVL